MATSRSDSESTCIIHFDGKEGEIKKLTEGTLAKIIDIRKQWLNLPSSYQAFTAVAQKSLDFIHDDSDVTSVKETCGYHMGCYRTFTDINKLDRAKTTLANAGRKRSAEPMERIEQTEKRRKPEKVARTTRQTIEKLMAHPCPRSSNVLPDICLICKLPGPLYLTDQVFILFLHLGCFSVSCYY